jgi:recA bacterial DNA recombination protein
VVAAPVLPPNPSPSPSSSLPRRDEHARAQLRAAATRAAPAVLAGERLLAVAGPIGHLLPAGGVRRGSTVALDGPPGAGSTTVAFLLAAATTSVGEWVAVVDPDDTLGARAAAEMGVALERCAVVRPVSPDRWPMVVGALLDGVSLVAAVVPPSLRSGDARRLTARARERATVLVTLGPWPVEASLRLHACGWNWSGLAADGGLLADRELDVRVEGKGVRAHARAG